MTLKRTPLYERHAQLGARLVDFGGWEMPVQYASILDEHRAVRKRAGLFDVCHMGEVRVAGSEALPFLRHVLTNDAADLTVGQAQYTLMCKPDGGVIDDLIAYRLDEAEYLLVVNASNTSKNHGWLADHAGAGVDVDDVSDSKGLVALQGPEAEVILQPLTDADLTTSRYYHALDGEVAGFSAFVSRTGYTGEDGFEIMVAAEHTGRVWDTLREAGEERGLVPAGLGARDTLRLEAAMPLYGHELDANTNPLEAGLGYFVKLDKSDFIGREALIEVKEQGLDRKLIGFQMTGRGIARQGYAIQRDGEKVGEVTSGTFAPYLEQAIGMGFVTPDLAQPGTEIEIVIRGRPVEAELVKRPFYERKQ
ncbi:MAG: Aminomethyltransferase [Anaerolineales bacterium]|nr:Aminomethyltransferase [Anaerolineales bacterium]